MSSGGFAAKRMTVAPGLSSSLGGSKGLRFNQSGAKEDSSMNQSLPPKNDDSEKQSLGSSITGKLGRLGFDREEVPLKKPFEDVAMEGVNDVDMQDVFAGRGGEPQEDVDMDREEDEVAQVTNVSSKKLGLQRPTASIATIPQRAANNFVMDEDGDEIQRLLREAENNLDADPALRDQKLFILNHIQQLREGDLLKRVDSLVALNEVISATSSTNQAEQPA